MPDSTHSGRLYRGVWRWYRSRPYRVGHTNCRFSINFYVVSCTIIRVYSQWTLVQVGLAAIHGSAYKLDDFRTICMSHPVLSPFWLHKVQHRNYKTFVQFPHPGNSPEGGVPFRTPEIPARGGTPPPGNFPCAGLLPPPGNFLGAEIERKSY